MDLLRYELKHVIFETKSSTITPLITLKADLLLHHDVEERVDEFVGTRRTREPVRRNMEQLVNLMVKEITENLLPILIAQLCNQGSNQGNGRNQNGDAVNDNIQGDVRNVIDVVRENELTNIYKYFMLDANITLGKVMINLPSIVIPTRIEENHVNV
nr:hypothetical protein [Tanacetum cinerariifolium]